ncbi:hypothetical protein DFS34DRAFT_136612 [Phlyctochytrium arcticum]|nr:hypothetical protein DFS34DRAFT_136612 [Phlyctochytrium arcticum]
MFEKELGVSKKLQKNPDMCVDSAFASVSQRYYGEGRERFSAAWRVAPANGVSHTDSASDALSHLPISGINFELLTSSSWCKWAKFAPKGTAGLDALCAVVSRKRLPKPDAPRIGLHMMTARQANYIMFLEPIVKLSTWAATLISIDDCDGPPLLPVVAV